MIRARLVWLAGALALTAAAFAQTTDTTTTTTTTQTAKPLIGKQLLWLGGTMTTCPEGTTPTTVMTSSGPKKACIVNQQTSSTSTSTDTQTATDTAPQ